MRLTTEQIEMRKCHLNASEFAAVLGLSPYRGDDRTSVWSAKMGLTAREFSEEDNEGLFWGHELEPVIASRFEVKSGMRLVHGGTFEHPTEKWCAATVDRRIMGKRQNLEIKCVGSPMCFDWKPEDSAGIPHHVMVQIQIQMAVTQCASTYVAALLAGTRLGVWEVPSESDLQNHLLVEGRKFWQSVQTGRIPDLTDSESTRKLLQALYPRDERPVRIATADETAIAYQRHYAAQLADKYEGDKRTHDHQLMAACAEHGGVRGDEWSFSWRVGKSGNRTSRFTWRGEK